MFKYMYNSDKSLRIGAVDPLNNYFDGYLSNIAILQGAINGPGNLHGVLYNNGTPPKLTGFASDYGIVVRHWWKLDEGSGNTIIDYGTGAKNGTIINNSSANNVWDNTGINHLGKVALITTQNNHGLTTGDIISIDSATASDRDYSGSCEVLSTPTTKTFTCNQFWANPSAATISNMKVHKITSVSVTGDADYTTGSYLPDTYTGTKKRLIIKPNGTSIGNNARIILEIDAITETETESSTIDSIGMVYRPPSKVRV